MKKTFILSEDAKNYYLKDTNPNKTATPFMIEKENLKFDTTAFYNYVFDQIDDEHLIEIKSELDANDKRGKVVFSTIEEIVQGVMERFKSP